MPLEYLIVILVVIVIECAVAFAVGLRTLRQQQAVLLANLFTNTPLYYIVWIGYIATLQEMIVAQLVVTAVEAAALFFALKSKHKRRLILAVLLMNAVTFVASLAYLGLLPN